MISLYIMIEKVLFLEFYVEFYFQSNHVVLDGHIFFTLFQEIHETWDVLNNCFERFLQFSLQSGCRSLTLFKDVSPLALLLVFFLCCDRVN